MSGTQKELKIHGQKGYFWRSRAVAKKNTLQVVGASPYFHKTSSTLQRAFCESLRKIGQELRSGQPMAGHPKKLQKRPFSRASGGRSRDAFKLVRDSPYFHKSSNTLQRAFCESLRKIGQELRSGQPLAGHELFVGKNNRFVQLSRITTRAALVFTRPRLHYEVALA